MELNKQIDLTVAGFIFHNKKVLLIYNKKYNMWLGVGGHIKENETPIQTLLRKVYQEINVEIQIINPIKHRVIEVSDTTIENYPIPFHADIHNATDHYHYAQYYLYKPKYIHRFKPIISEKEKSITRLKLFTQDEALNTNDIPVVTKRILRVAFNIVDK